MREQRSPQFGLLQSYGDYVDDNDSPRNFYVGNRRKVHHHKPHYHHKPLIGGHGCRGYGCGGRYVRVYIYV